MKFTSFTLKIMICAVVFSNQAISHQMKEAISVVYFNQSNKHVEIAHRVYVHDAEVVLKTLFGKDKKLLEDPQSQFEFSQYITSHFSLQLDSKVLKLKLLGHEVNGQHLWVYQEHPYSTEPNQITIKYNAMMDQWPDQRNVINIEGLGSLKSIHMQGSNVIQVIDIE